jgi:hypothetical protein
MGNNPNLLVFNKKTWGVDILTDMPPSSLLDLKKGSNYVKEQK